MTNFSNPKAFRFLIFLILATFIWAGPLIRQKIDPSLFYFPRWVMFRGIGLNLMDVRFFKQGPDGEEIAVNRFNIIYQGPPHQAPKWIRKIKGKAGLARVARALCNKLGPQTDLRARIRIAKPSGWETSNLGNQNLCHK